MVSGSKGKIDPYAKRSKKIMKYLVMCTKCSKWVHARCIKMKRVTTTMVKGCICEQHDMTIKEPDKEI